VSSVRHDLLEHQVPILSVLNIKHKIGIVVVDDAVCSEKWSCRISRGNMMNSHRAKTEHNLLYHPQHLFEEN
jgi:hypothetical protein